MCHSGMLEHSVAMIPFLLIHALEIGRESMRIMPTCEYLGYLERLLLLDTYQGRVCPEGFGEEGFYAFKSTRQ